MRRPPEPAGASVLLALGGNLGDVLATFAGTLTALAAAGAPPVAISRAYRTAAWVAAGAAPGPDYWNAACELRTPMSPDALLGLCRALERTAGRRHSGRRWAPRPLDLDLLAYGRRVRRGARLCLPHPRLAERPFVLRPLAELPGFCLPVYERWPAELLAALPDPDAGILERRAGWLRGP